MMRRVRGFTLLEAIIALVIFAMGAFSLYGWLSTNLITLDRARSGSEALVVKQSALELLRDVNPMLTPSGEREAGTLQVQWTAEPLQPTRRGSSQIGGPSFYEVGLYQMQVRVRDGGREVGEFSLRQLGYRLDGSSGG
ncbi:MAG: type II secretion system protein [Xanthomonadaceae bacterium]|nr:type II secretion system protein [Xanthomonadaceae bacterium]MDP2184488.1 type II secretion system protein [Xanthomonadales bacterium]MDZ4115392.1 type II secretion system protein [Xanthomonadaceae bacterium]MDZ4379562.1 type II secretion system protein [Xanthomonadaceae bacterium]